MQAFRQLTGFRSVALISLRDFKGASREGIQHTGQRRNFQLFEIFSKEAREKRKQRLREDLQRGAFDDFKELKDTGGKLWHASLKLLPPSAAKSFPSIQVSPAAGGKAQFPPPKGKSVPDATLVCAGFKAGSEEMLASWSRPFLQAFAELPPHHGNTRLIELSIVESRVMSIWPFRAMVMRASKRAAAAEAKTTQGPQSEQRQVASIPDCVASGTAQTAQPAHRIRDDQQSKQHNANFDAIGAQGAALGDDSSDQHLPQQPQGSAAAGRGPFGLSRQDLFFFGDPYDLSKDLGITNRLTGYIFLVDRHARVRFRGCGHATPKEIAALLLATEQLLIKSKLLTGVPMEPRKVGGSA